MDPPGNETMRSQAKLSMRGERTRSAPAVSAAGNSPFKLEWHPSLSAAVKLDRECVRQRVLRGVGPASGINHAPGLRRHIAAIMADMVKGGNAQPSGDGNFHERQSGAFIAGGGPLACEKTHRRYSIMGGDENERAIEDGMVAGLPGFQRLHGRS